MAELSLSRTEMLLLSGTANRPLAEEMAQQLNQPLCAVTLRHFADGELFVMGDHRQNSADSRNFGPIEVSHVVGRAWLRYWPFDAFTILPVPSHPELARPAP